MKLCPEHKQRFNQRTISAVLFLLIFLSINVSLPTPSAHSNRPDEHAMPAVDEQIYVRVNQLGFAPRDVKTAVAISRTTLPASFQVVHAATNRVVFEGRTVPIPGKWGQFDHHAELNFTALQKEGTYSIQLRTSAERLGSVITHSPSTPMVGETPAVPVVSSPRFEIKARLYTGVPDLL